MELFRLFCKKSGQAFPDFVVGYAEFVAFGRLVIVLDGEVSALIDYRKQRLFESGIANKHIDWIVFARHLVEVYSVVFKQSDEISG